MILFLLVAIVIMIASFVVLIPLALIAIFAWAFAKACWEAWRDR